MRDANTHPHPILIPFLQALTEGQREVFEERAAILEFEAGLDRPLAEALAMLEVIRQHGWPLPESH